MVEISIGRGRDLCDHLDVSGISPKKYDCKNCPIKRNPHFVCHPHNGTMTVKVVGGITRSTIEEFKEDAVCCKE